MTFEEWYGILNGLASTHNKNVVDIDACREDYDTGKTPEDSFYGQFPACRPSPGDDSLAAQEQEQEQETQPKTHCNCGQSLNYIDLEKGSCPCCGESLG